jgi:hypothetical protein
LQGAEHVGKKMLFDGEKKAVAERKYGVFANVRNQWPTRENPARLYPPTSELALAT